MSLSGTRTLTMNELSDLLKQFIAGSTWIFAKTYAETWPHEYIVQERVENDLFLELAGHIDTHGFESNFTARARPTSISKATPTGTWATSSTAAPACSPPASGGHVSWTGWWEPPPQSRRAIARESEPGAIATGFFYHQSKSGNLSPCSLFT